MSRKKSVRLCVPGGRFVPANTAGLFLYARARPNSGSEHFRHMSDTNANDWSTRRFPVRVRPAGEEKALRALPLDFPDDPKLFTEAVVFYRGEAHQILAAVRS